MDKKIKASKTILMAINITITDKPKVLQELETKRIQTHNARNYLGQFHRIRPRMYIQGKLFNVTLTSQTPCQHNNKFDRSDTNSNSIPQDAINDV